MAKFRPTIKSGFSLVELILAIALFSLFATALIGLLWAAYGSEIQAAQKDQATRYAQQGLEAARSIRRQGWNLLVNGTYGLSSGSGFWQFNGSNDLLDDGRYNRTVTIADACRDNGGAIVDCQAGGAIIDLHTKQAIANVSYTSITGVANTVTLTTYLTTWQTRDWLQTNWAGGDGQSIWSDVNRYDSDDGSINSSNGELKLRFEPSNGAAVWTFDVPTDYSFDSAKVAVTAGSAQLVSTAGTTELANTPADTFEFDPSDGTFADIVPVSGNIYAIAYQGMGSDGFIVTVSIDGSGNIGSVIDSFEFNTADGQEPDLIHVSGDIFAVAFRGPDSDGFVNTVAIDSSGNIGSVIDSLEYDTSSGSTPSIAHVSGTIYAVAYTGPGSDGWLATFTIDGLGSIANAVTDRLEFDTSNGFEPSLVTIDSDTIAVAYLGTGADGFVISAQVDGSGNISNTVTDTLEFDAADGAEPSIVYVSGDVYAVAYRGPGNDGWLATVTIDSSGAISNAIVDSLEFDTADGFEPSIAHVSGDIFAVAYRGPSGDGFVSLIQIQAGGTIDNTVLDTLEYDTSTGNRPNLVVVNANMLAVVYQGSGNDGWLVTVGIVSGGGTYPTDRPTINPVSGQSIVNLLGWTGFTETATKNGGEIYYQLSNDDGGSWLFWDGGAWVSAGLTDYNPATIVNDNIVSLATTTSSIMFRAFLASDGTQQVQLNELSIEYSGGSGGGYATAGWLLSSALNMTGPAAVNLIKWTQTIPSCSPGCEVKLQLRTAPDAAGSPGSWTDWYGASGSGTYFTGGNETIVPTALNNNQWLQYRVELIGDGADTPVLQDVTINYLP